MDAIACNVLAILAANTSRDPDIKAISDNRTGSSVLGSQFWCDVGVADAKDRVLGSCTEPNNAESHVVHSLPCMLTGVSRSHRALMTD